MSIGARIKHERERVGLTISALAEIASAGKNTVIDWQNDVSSPPASKLAALAAAGLDVLYILTGQRTGDQPAPALSRREAALLDNYRHSSDEARSAIDKTSAAFAQQAALHDHGKSSTAFQQDLKTKPARRAK